ncbi:MAG: MauE/DoxX family redox-associated membrane protein [Acidimicrobiia bacterium]
MTATDVAVAARVVIALVLLASGVGKLVALPRSTAGFRQNLGRYAFVAYGVALSLPVAELLVAAALLFVDSVWPAYVAVALFVVFTAVLVRRIVKDDRRPCNCFGAASSKRAVSTLSLVRNGWFLVLSVLATGAASVHEPTATVETVVLGVVFAGISAWFVVKA